jgi:hypothetical protein
VATDDGTASARGVVPEEHAVVAGATATEDEAVAGVAVITVAEVKAEEEKKEQQPSRVFG